MKENLFLYLFYFFCKVKTIYFFIIFPELKKIYFIKEKK